MTSVLEGLRQVEHHEFEASMVYMVNFRLHSEWTMF